MGLENNKDGDLPAGIVSEMMSLKKSIAGRDASIGELKVKIKQLQDKIDNYDRAFLLWLEMKEQAKKGE